MTASVATAAAPVGIVVALRSEARALRRGAGAPAATELLHVSGIGADRAGAAAGELLQRGARALVSWGVAGGLDPVLATGAAVLPERVVAADGESFAVDAEWRRRLANRLTGHANLCCASGTIVESATVVATQAEKAALHARSRATAVDMESAAVARLAHRASVPFLVVRAVCDPATLALPRAAMVAVTPCGGVRPLRLAAELARRPGELADLLRLRRAFRCAESTLRRIATSAGWRLGFG